VAPHRGPIAPQCPVGRGKNSLSQGGQHALRLWVEKVKRALGQVHIGQQPAPRFCHRPLPARHQPTMKPIPGRRAGRRLRWRIGLRLQLHAPGQRHRLARKPQRQGNFGQQIGVLRQKRHRARKMQAFQRRLLQIDLLAPII